MHLQAKDKQKWTEWNINPPRSSGRSNRPTIKFLIQQYVQSLLTLPPPIANLSFSVLQDPYMHQLWQPQGSPVHLLVQGEGYNPERLFPRNLLRLPQSLNENIMRRNMNEISPTSVLRWRWRVLGWVPNCSMLVIEWRLWSGSLRINLEHDSSVNIMSFKHTPSPEISCDKEDCMLPLLWIDLESSNWRRKPNEGEIGEYFNTFFVRSYLSACKSAWFNSLRMQICENPADCLIFFNIFFANRKGHCLPGKSDPLGACGVMAQTGEQR